MKLTSISFENFMPYKGKTTIDFPQDEARNVMVVFGDNMRGKTSFLNALRWAFYGKAYGRHLREIPLQDILNREAASEGDWVIECNVKFEADGHKYDLRRRAVKRDIVAEPSRPEDFEVKVGLQKDGSSLSGYLIEAEVNRYVPEQVSRFFLFDGELLQEYENLLIEGSEQGRHIKEAIEQVLGVPTLINGRTEAQTLLKQYQKLQSKDMAQIQGLERQIQRQAELFTKQSSYEADVENLRELAKKTRAEREQLDDELEKVDSVHDAKIKIDGLVANQQKIIARIDEAEVERLGLIKDAWKDLLEPRLRVKRDELFASYERVGDEVKVKHGLIAKLETLEKIVSGAECPVCHSKPESGIRENAQREFDSIKSKLNEINVDPVIQSEIAAQIKEIDKLIGRGVSQSIASLDAEISRIGVDLTKTENEIEKLRHQIEGYDTAAISKKRALRDSLIRQEGITEVNIQEILRKLDEVRKDILMISKALEANAGSTGSRSTNLVKTCTALEEIFNTSIERLRDRLKMRVAEKATEAFHQLSTQSLYKNLEINENYGLNIIDDTNSKVNVRSAGAEQIVALSLIDGLARTGRSVGPVVMDTPFGRLDMKHRDRILRYLPNTTSQLVLLVHDGEINRSFDLQPIADRIGAEYEIKEINPRYSKIERITK